MKKETIIPQVWKQGISLLLSCAVAAAVLPAGTLLVSAAEPELIKAGSVNATADTMTISQPFPTWTGGSYSFRIPALISVENGEHSGNLVAAADARYATPGDGGGLDTIASVSADMGKTWNYSFPIWFPDSKGYAGKNATTVIDPALVEGPDGTVYCMADVNPSGITTHYGAIPEGTGYVEIGGAKRLALTDNYANAGRNPAADTTSYAYYVGDFDAEGYAPVLRRTDSTATEWRVDEWYNIEKKENGIFVPLTQKQVNTDEDVQQNVFYKDSELHVYNIGYIWMVESEDGGKSWENPRILNDQVKPETGESYILVSPGKGLTTSEGVITVPFYGNQGGEKASFIYSKDNGVTWTRTNNVTHLASAGKSSESEMVELSDGTLRMFSRTSKNALNHICYTDAVKDENGNYRMGTMVDTGVSCWSDCNVTAIRYSRQVDGKDLILVTCPAGTTSRKNGRIYTFLVNNDAGRTMSLLDTYDIKDPEYDDIFAYSCMTEQKDGRIGLLWEPTTDGYIGESPYELFYTSYDILEVAPNAALADTSVEVELYEGKASYTRSYSGDGTVTKEPDTGIAAVSVDKRTDGRVEVTITKGSAAGTTEAVIDGVTYRISVTNGAKQVILEQGGSFTVEGAEADVVSGNAEAVQVDFAGKYALCDHIANTADTDNAFAATVNQATDLENARMTFERRGENTWYIRNDFIEHYLTNTSQAYYFNPVPENMTVEAVEEEQGTVFRIKNSSDSYIVYYYTNSIFDRSSYNESWTEGTYDLTLLKKKDAVSGDDVIPGYERVSEIVSGESYLITCIRENDVIVLYPYTEDVASWTNEAAVGNSVKLKRTKLFRKEQGLVNRMTITGLLAGETASVRVGEVLYSIEVGEPVSKGAVVVSFTSAREAAAAVIGKGQGEYTDASWRRMTEAYGAAQQAGADSSVTELKEIMRDLKDAEAGLTVRDRKLEAAKAQAQNTFAEAKKEYEAGQGDYTAQSWNTFKKAYEALENAMENADAAVLSGLTEELKAARANLTKNISNTDHTPATVEAPSIKAVKAAAQKKGVFVAITVNAVAGADHYAVYRTANGKTVLVGNTKSGGTVLTDKNPAAKKASYYAVALSSDGKEISGKGQAKTITMAQTAKLKKVARTFQGMTIKWAKSKQAVKYVIYRSTKKVSGYVRIATVSKKKLSWLDKKAKKGRKYYYKIAVRAKGKVSLMSKAKAGKF